MTKENKIWHTYNIHDRPSSHKEILADTGFHHDVVVIEPKNWNNGLCGYIKRWAYLSDIIASSKALEVAIDRLTVLEQCPYQGGEESVKLGVRVCAAAGLQKIRETIKVDNNHKKS